MFGSLKERQRIIHHHAIYRCRQPGESESDIRSLADQELHLVA